MPSPVAHLSVGAAFWFFWRRHRPASAGETRLQLAAQGAGFLAASLLPDVDIIPGLLFGEMHRFHNQQFHSLSAGLIVSALLAMAVRSIRPGKRAELFFILWISFTLHLIMDTLTYGRGVYLLWPLSAERMQPSFLVFRGLRWSEGLWYSGHLLTFAEESIFALLLAVSAISGHVLKTKTRRFRSSETAGR